MIQVQILEDDDLIQPDDWCRPLAIVSMSGGMSDGYSFKNMYSGTPENNAKWVRVSSVLGEVWFGSTVKSYVRRTQARMEFVRGDVPRSHRLSMTGYSDLGVLVKKLKKRPVREFYYDDDIPF